MRFSLEKFPEIKSDEMANFLHVDPKEVTGDTDFVSTVQMHDPIEDKTSVTESEIEIQ